MNFSESLICVFQKKLFEAILTYLNFIWSKFSIIIFKNYARAAPFIAAIWDEFGEQHQLQSIKKNTIIYNARLERFWRINVVDLMHILVGLFCR